ncbi:MULTISPECIES: peptidoglycan D,D-transpeptidase FtsI family protein [Corynebacterium]|uniref:Penicillin-binding protein 2 n=4 Tax=Corynebacterium TaxID=1716 RepID=A0AB37G936_CORAY|nr:penicillin-binding protein 2 [Corynebacterium amycolatum]MBC6747041.1 penicillin-binding protein 2 [Corynebacterium sp. LK25]MBC6769104.1 penicillin-binding protein 2 [Corynebacterium sp. LK15]MBC6793968.1 penicillin-binding protein 2 [Corynebacterium sp. LK26]MBC6829759.1 penicillin-binding protein 2 [Corynebacterium sp. LK32]TXS59114.1 penicillin-binding protein 2 [Corynebacterium sp. LK19]TXS86366.1 penicillin-binding protein 2 [Corynebacterium sp. LK10]
MIRSEDDYPNRGGGYDFGERAYRITSRERRDQSRVRDGQRSRRLDANTNRSVPPREKMRISNKDFIRRRNWLQFIGAIAVVVLVSRLAWVQLVAGPDLSAAAQNQRTVEVVDAARRGAILDRNGAQLAFTMEARSITVHPNTLRKWIGDAHKQRPDDVAAYDERLEQIAKDLPKLLDVADIDAEKSGSSRRRQAEPETEENSVMSAPSRVSSKDILEKLRNEDSTYEVLVRNVDPDKAAAIVEKYPELVAERQDIRQYPNGATAANVIGKIGMDGVGQFGFEASRDATLQGINGGKTIDIASNGVAIPGSTRDVHAAVDGTTYELTLDLDMQYFVQQQVNQAKANSGAKDASAVVLDAKTGEVLAMAQADTANPNKDMGAELEEGRTIGNSAVSNPFEPGSVAKIITAAAAIEDGKTTPDEVLQVPGTIDMAGVTVRDAWEHGTEAFTTTGVFGKSSNVGTLMLAERLGQDRFAEMLHLFGLGQSTGIELPSESSGFVPQRPQWSGGTFANLPIGQGMAMTLLQMTGVFQAIANDGERIPPRMIRSTISPDGTKTATERPETVRVVSPETAQTVRAMFEGVMQSDPTGQQSGTAAGNSIEGYSLTGKTGTAQKFDPDTGAYSNSKYHITFAGIAPADDPRFVIGIMLDEPQRGVHGDGGQSAAPLFKDIAAWALNRYNVPPSPPREGKLLLQP